MVPGNNEGDVAGLRSGDVRPARIQEVDEDHDQRDDQQQVNESADCFLEKKKADQPEHNQHDADC